MGGLDRDLAIKIDLGTGSATVNFFKDFSKKKKKNGSTNFINRLKDLLILFLVALLLDFHPLSAVKF